MKRVKNLLLLALLTMPLLALSYGCHADADPETGEATIDLGEEN